MSVVRSELKQATGVELGVSHAPEVVAALEEIAKVELELRTTGDAAMLERFGDAEKGAALAELLGHAGLSIEEAHIVDQLSWMPEGMKLARAYLQTIRVGLGPAELEPARASSDDLRIVRDHDHGGAALHLGE